MNALMYRLSLLNFMAFFCLYGMQQPQPLAQPPFHINITTNATALPINNVNLEHTSTVQVSNASTALAKTSQFLQQLPALSSTYSGHFTAACAQYKYHLIGLLTVSWYGTIWWYLFNTHNYFEQKENWSLWPHTITFETLLTMPHDETLKLLLTALQMRYLNAQEPTDGIYPLVKFIQACEYEEKIIRKYIYYATWLKRTRLYRLPFLPTLQQEKAENLLHRLLFIQTIFKTWAAQQNCLRLSM